MQKSYTYREIIQRTKKRKFRFARYMSQDGIGAKGIFGSIERSDMDITSFGNEKSVSSCFGSQSQHA